MWVYLTNRLSSHPPRHIEQCMEGKVSAWGNMSGWFFRDLLLLSLWSRCSFSQLSYIIVLGGGKGGEAACIFGISGNGWIVLLSVGIVVWVMSHLLGMMLPSMLCQLRLSLYLSNF